MNDRPLATLIKVALCRLAYSLGLTGLMLRRLVADGLYVFNYHGFSTFANDYRRHGKLTESAYGDNFRKQLKLLARHLGPALPFDLENPGERGPRYMVTFDDGYLDNHAIALKALEENDTPAAFMVVTGAVGGQSPLWHDRVRARFARIQPRTPIGAMKIKKACKRALSRSKAVALAKRRPLGAGGGAVSQTPKLMGWIELDQAVAKGIRLGGHTRSHPLLSTLSSEEKWDEINHCRKVLELARGNSPELFAYPDGGPESFDEETKRIVARCGFRFAFTTTGGVNTCDTDPLELKRIGVNPSDPAPVLAAKIALVSLAHRLHATGRERSWARRLIPLSPPLSASAGQKANG